MTIDNPQTTPAKVILIEDNHEYRKAVTIALERIKQIELVAKYGTAEEALREIQNNPLLQSLDVVLLDLNLPNLTGLESIPWIRKYAPQAKIIILTQSEKKADVLSALQIGASGYLLKSSNIRQIKEAITTAIKGGASFDGKISNHILAQLQENPPKVILNEELSERELQVLQQLSQGSTKKEIAKALKISPHTVASHVKHIYEKLAVLNGPAAISKAYEAGILPLE